MSDRDDLVPGTAQGELEHILGDVAAARMFVDSGVPVAIKGSYTRTDGFVDLWQREGDTHVRFWEDPAHPRGPKGAEPIPDSI